uniref:F0F1 ATP synthase subunit B n=2 Tax=Faecalicatena contorta TaxID=39482 RepID=UPI00359C8B3B
MKVQLYQDLLTINWNLLFSLITVVVLVLILKKFFFEKVHQFMEARQQQVVNTLEEAQTTREEAQQKLEEYEAQMAFAESEKREIIKKAMQEAQAQAGAVLETASKEAGQVREQTRREIERDKMIAKKELQREIGDMAVLAAGKIIGEELNPKRQAEVVEKIIEEAEDSSWKE